MSLKTHLFGQRHLAAMLWSFSAILVPYITCLLTYLLTYFLKLAEVNNC